MKYPRLFVISALLIVAGGAGVLIVTSRRTAAEDEAPPPPPPPGIIQPELRECRLRIGSRTLAPVRVIPPATRVFEPAFPETEIGGLRVNLDEATVIAVDAATRRRRWKAVAPDGFLLRWLAHEGKTAYLEGQPAPRDSKTKKPGSARLRRLDLRTGKWLAELPLGSGRERDAIMAAQPSPDRIAILSLAPGWDDPEAKSAADYRVTCVRLADRQPLWSRTFPSGGPRPGPGAFLLSQYGPAYAVAALQPLSWMGSELIVCAGPKEELLCLSGDTGKPRWQLGRLWEFQRGFTGPSVWAHHLSRFGGDRFGERGEPAKERREQFDKQFDCALIGGPVVTPLKLQTTDFDKNSYSLFVGVSRGPASGFGGYVSDCILYEINEDGAPIAVVNAPRMVDGGQFARVPNGVVWTGQDASLVRLAASPNRQPAHSSPGSPNLLLRLAWYQQSSEEDPVAWLVADRATGEVGFSDRSAFSSAGGGYVNAEAESVYHFPLAMAALETGAAQGLTLDVPFKGKLPKPTTNYRSRRGGQGRMVMHTWGPYVLGLTRIRVQAGKLELTLGMENWAAGLEFDLNQIEPLPVGGRR